MKISKEIILNMGSYCIVLLCLIYFFFGKSFDKNSVCFLGQRFCVQKSISDNKEVHEPTLSNGREVYKEQSYVPINVSELKWMIKSNKKKDLLKENFVLRGMVYKEEDLLKDGLFGLVRVSLWCCAADATAHGIRVVYNNSNSFKHGEWIKVYGRLEESDKLSQGRILIPEKIHKVKPPKDPYILDWSNKEPFNY